MSRGSVGLRISFRQIALATATALVLAPLSLSLATSAQAAPDASGLTATWAVGLTSPVSGTGTVGMSSQKLSLSTDGRHAASVWIESHGYPISTGPSVSQVFFASATIDGGSANWTNPLLISPAGVNASDPQVGISEDGSRATTSWISDEGSGTNGIRSVSLVMTSTSTTPGISTLITDPGQSASSPSLGLSPDGMTATVCWYSYVLGQVTLMTRTFRVEASGTPWALSSVEISNRSSSTRELSFAYSGDGNHVAAAWIQDGMAGIFVRTAVISGGQATWGATSNIPFITTLIPPEAPTGIRIALSFDGQSAAVLWQHGGMGPLNVVGGQFSGSAWSWSPVPNVFSATSTLSPVLAMSSDGHRIAVVWVVTERSVVTAWRDYFRVSAAIGEVSGLTVTMGSPTIASAVELSSGGAAIALSSDGSRSLLTWVSDTPSGYSFNSSSASILGSSATWDLTPTLITTQTNAPDWGVPMGMSVNGYRATMIWNDSVAANIRWASALINPDPTPTPLPAPILNPIANTDPIAVPTVAPTAKPAVVPTVTPTPTPTPTQRIVPAVALLAQVPAKNCVIKLKALVRDGSTRVTKARCKTTAGSPISVKVFATRSSRTRVNATKRRDYAIVKTKTGATYIRTLGNKVALTVKWSAPASPGFVAYSKISKLRS